MSPLSIYKRLKSVRFSASLRGKPGRMTATPQENALIRFQRSGYKLFKGLNLVDFYQASAKLERSLGPRGDPFGAFSDLHGKDCHNTDIGVLIELYRDQAISLRIPEGTGG